MTNDATPAAPGVRRLLRGVFAGSASALGVIALLTFLGSILAPGSFASQSFGVLVIYLILVGAAATAGGWLAGRIAPSQAFPAAALVAIVLGIGGVAGARLVGLVVGGPLWLGGAIGGVAPGGAILGGLMNWAGSEE